MLQFSKEIKLNNHLPNNLLPISEHVFHGLTCYISKQFISLFKKRNEEMYLAKIKSNQANPEISWINL